MRNKGVAGAILLLASTVLSSAAGICRALSDVAAATLGFASTSQLGGIYVFQYIISLLLFLSGICLMIAGARESRKRIDG